MSLPNFYHFLYQLVKWFAIVRQSLALSVAKTAVIQMKSAIITSKFGTLFALLLVRRSPRNKVIFANHHPVVLQLFRRMWMRAY